MQYRNFGKLDWQCSALGFGAMRLPQESDDMASPVDIPEAIRLMRYAIDNGVNYIDTSFPYFTGGSERAVGLALKDGYRQKVRLAEKLSFVALKSSDEYERFFESQLKRLQVDKMDFYALHAMNARTWQQARDWKALDFMEKKLAEGKIDYLGFSFHDDFELFKEIIDYYDDWAFCQVQYNYLDENQQAGRRGIEYVASKGLGIVVMEPLRGGALVTPFPPEVEKDWVEPLRRRSRVEWSLDWIWNHPEISVVLSGMSTMEQVEQNVAYAARSAPGMLDGEDLAFFKTATDFYQSKVPVPCTACRYCQPCSQGVNIPRIFELYNDRMATGNVQPVLWYKLDDLGLPYEQRATNCIECGECVEECPQKIDIPAELKKAHKELTVELEGRRPPADNISFDV